MTPDDPRILLCFGWSYCAKRLVEMLPKSDFQQIRATYRNPEDAQELREAGIVPVPFIGDGGVPLEMLHDVTHVLSSIPPGENGDPVLRRAHTALFEARHLAWVGYLSTTGVYGDRQGGWVDETSDLKPTGKRGQYRLAAEQAWLAFRNQAGEPLPMHIFRLAGIYGPGRNALAQLQAGKKTQIVKKGQIFSRIHVEDIAQTLMASIDQPAPGRVYNVCDDEPGPPQDVLVCAADLLGMKPPAEVPFEQADMSPMARSFYRDSKRVSNARIRVELGVHLRFPNYRKGLVALAHDFHKAPAPDAENEPPPGSGQD